MAPLLAPQQPQRTDGSLQLPWHPGRARLCGCERAGAVDVRSGWESAICGPDVRRGGVGRVMAIGGRGS